MDDEKVTPDKNRPRASFVVNRVLIVLAVAIVLIGLSLGHWHIVLRNAILL